MAKWWQMVHDTELLSIATLTVFDCRYGYEHAYLLHPKAPFKETNSRIPEPYAQQWVWRQPEDVTHADYTSVVYYKQRDALSKFAEGKKWTFADIRPDAIVSIWAIMENKICTNNQGRVCSQ